MGSALGEAAEGGVVVADSELVQPGGVVEVAAGVLEGVGDLFGLAAGNAVGVVAVTVDPDTGALDQAGDAAEVVRTGSRRHQRPCGATTPTDLATRRSPSTAKSPVAQSTTAPYLLRRKACTARAAAARAPIAVVTGLSPARRSSARNTTKRRESAANSAAHPRFTESSRGNLPCAGS